nr:MAG TPA: hypothetical protein [Caudoviricetes sp.]
MRFMSLTFVFKIAIINYKLNLSCRKSDERRNEHEKKHKHLKVGLRKLQKVLQVLKLICTVLKLLPNTLKRILTG